MNSASESNSRTILLGRLGIAAQYGISRSAAENFGLSKLPRYPMFARMSSGPPSSDAPARRVYTISQLNAEARVLLERGLAVVWVEGELSNLSQPASGHWYFSLKDRNAQIRCAMFRQRNIAVGFAPRAGQQLLARGRVSIYEARGDYQLNVEHLEEAGVGALRREFEKLKVKLATEGLFALEHKRPLPAFPQRIGVITSPTAAALRDILHVLARRFAPANVLIYPTPVQGAAAAPGIIAALELASRRAECEVLILARGGGSLEDLWAFNDERVARAIRACALPVVTGIGHEIDFTIADFAADARAPTPSAAAESVVPDRQTWVTALGRSAQRLIAAMRRELRGGVSRLDTALQRLSLAHPGVRLAQQQQRLDDLEQRISHALRSELHHKRGRLADVFARLVRHSPDRLVRDLRVRHELFAGRLQHALLASIARAEHRLGLAQRTLDTVSPLATLARGFAIITRPADGALIADAARVNIGDEIEARLDRGHLRARVLGKS
jgi:exodeoxyribonuclease VII large subunit